MRRSLVVLALGTLVFVAPAARADVAPKKGGCTMTEHSAGSWALAAVPALALALVERRRRARRA